MKPKTPRSHMEQRIAHAQGYEIQVKGSGDGLWHNQEFPSWNDSYEYRVKPEREYPVTSLTVKEVMKIFDDAEPDSGHSFIAVANAALKRHIDENEGMAKEAYINGLEAAISIINKSTMIIPYDMFKEYDNFRISIVGRIEKEIAAARV